MFYETSVEEALNEAFACRDARRPLRGSLLVGVLALAAGPLAGCSHPVKAAPPIDGFNGKLTAVTQHSVDVQTNTGLMHVQTDPSLTIYRQTPSDLGHVTPTSFVGVASVKQDDGTELATLILIFPAELRGAAEGSVILDPTPGTGHQSRMTNGSVAPVAVSRMTNGTVEKGGSTTLLVRYADGAQTISVPPGVPVTAVAPAHASLAAGDIVYVATDKSPIGALTTNKIFLVQSGGSQG